MTIATKLTVAGLALAAALTATACGPATPSTYGTPSSAACTQGPGEPPCPGGAGVWRPSNADSAIFAAQRFGAERIDIVTAHAALEAGRPVMVGLPDGGNDACHTLLLVPGDPKVWILNTSAVSSAGRAMDRDLLQYGCTGAVMPGDGPVAPAPNPPLDQPAARAAMAAAVPYIWAWPSGSTEACHTAVMLPTWDRWIMNRQGAAPVEGVALDRTYKEYGCTERGETVAPTDGGVR